jgi:hypothetical protein
MWISSRACHALPKSITAAALALVVLPLTVLAGPDGRRLTLGDNRASLEAGPSRSLTHDTKASSSERANQTTMPALVPPTVIAEAPAIRVAPPKDQTATPAFKPEPSAATTPARIERVRHTPDRKTKVTVKTGSETKHVRVTASSTKVAVRDHKVRVDAPYTRVAVDEGRVRVRAPFVDLDIRF